ncbi:NUDIX domain-containing protein [Pseudomonas putida]|uniref:NUDIX domain-containing protein n=1 Tax=Pseudomonas putida TaxID=303 RepID=A0A6I6XYJ7_PSEPU|nr:NUDIX domain-containing protein [Pseudomonas putida]QHG65189.1 NUDIX domain-containing protein [Pseudomonas putida]
MTEFRELHATIICLQAGKILLVRKAAPEWSLPGGKMDHGETQVEAARRELREETTLELVAAQFLGHHVLVSEEHWLYRMTVTASKTPSPSHEIVECHWFNIQELKLAPVKPITIELLKREGFLAPSSH